MSGFNSPVNTIDTYRKHPLGTPRRIGSVWYRYGYNAGADTLVAGEIVGFSQTGNTYGYISGTAADIIDGTSTSSPAAGMAVAAIPTTNWGWIQTQGPNQTAITTDGSVVAGACTIGGGASPDGTLITCADGNEENACATALVADTSTTSPAGTVMLNCDKFW